MTDQDLWEERATSEVIQSQAEDGRYRFEILTGLDALGLRLDKWIADHVDILTRARCKALIEDNNLTRNGEAFNDPSAKIKTGDVFVLQMPPIEDATPKPQDIPIDVLYEDNDLIVVNKRAGMVVHPAAGNWSGTLVNALLHHCGDSLSGIGGVARPGIVHRLDKDTSGVMVVAKNDAAHQGLTALFAAHDIERVYNAVVIGAPRPGVGTIEAALARQGAERKKMSIVDPWKNPNAKRAITHYKMLQHFGQGRAKLPGDSLASLVSCELETGRTHQIRAHMAHIGHPLIGDPLYGRGPGLSGLKPGDSAAEKAIAVLEKFKRQALHARILGFIHPISGEELRFEQEPPKDFENLIKALTEL